MSLLHSKNMSSSQYSRPSEYAANSPSFSIVPSDESDAEDIVATKPSQQDVMPIAEHSSGSKQAKKTKWRWSIEMCDRLIGCLYEYKIKKDFEGRDMEADLVSMYEDLRKAMAAIFPTDHFGPVEPSGSSQYHGSVDNNHLIAAYIEKEKKQIKIGYLRIKDKVKQIRCNFKKALIEGTRSGSGKIIIQHWDSLASIWGGCPSVTKISGAIISQDIAGIAQGENQDEDGDDCNGVSDTLVHEELPCNSEDSTESAAPKKRRLSDECSLESGKEPPTRKAVDNKCMKLQKPLSAHQRDQVMMRVARDELEVKKKNLEVLQQSSQNMEKMIGITAQSMTALGQQLGNGFALLAQALASNSAHQQYYPHPHFMPPGQHPASMPQQATNTANVSFSSMLNTMNRDDQEN